MPLLACLAMGLVETALAQSAVSGRVATPQVLPAGERALEPQTLIVRVSADGKPGDIRYETESAEQIRRLVTEAVGQWRFAPHQRDHQPVDWYTRLHIGLTGVPLDDGKKFGLKVTSVKLSGRGRPERMSPPRYPHDMMKKRKGAVVCVDVRLDDSGNPLSIDIPFVNGEAPKKGDPFASASRDAVKQWNFGSLEVDGVRYGLSETVRIPVTFTPESGGSPPPSSEQATCPELDNGETDTLRLLSEPVGKML